MAGKAFELGQVFETLFAATTQAMTLARIDRTDVACIERKVGRDS